MRARERAPLIESPTKVMCVDYFQYPYPFGKYDQIYVPEYNSGAMENVGAVTFNERELFRDPPTGKHTRDPRVESAGVHKEQCCKRV